MTCYRYIELNPVRGRMVQYPADYPWSSHRCNARGDDYRLITPHPLYRALRANPKQRQAAYRAMFEYQMSEQTLAEIRGATDNDQFQKRIERLTQRATRPKLRNADEISSQSDAE